ncbi:MAG: hypothetical protein NTX50_17925 [Candidatus Sumerlaeota bacterium]|nr:hypothetical protein [Candidatus Sumerlaeota bacterium]
MNSTPIETETAASGGRIKVFLRRHGQTLFDIYLFFAFSVWAAWQTYQTWTEGRLNYVEIAFAVQNVVLVTLILIRRRHRAVDMNIARQAVALVAFCSGFFFMGQPATGGRMALAISDAVIFIANVLGLITLLNLGRNFGILIACRQVTTSGLYDVVRHPMYGTDILLRVGFMISHFGLVTVGLFLASTVCYVYRAMLEEKFLSQYPEYREYMTRVRYRFIPGVF